MVGRLCVVLLVLVVCLSKKMTYYSHDQGDSDPKDNDGTKKQDYFDKKISKARSWLSNRFEKLEKGIGQMFSHRHSHRHNLDFESSFPYRLQTPIRTG